MTRLIYNHTESLELASTTASGIHETLDRAAASVKSWNETFGLSFYENILRFSLPPLSLLLGGYGLPPSLTRNFGLLVAGKLIHSCVYQNLIYYRMDGSRVNNTISTLDSSNTNSFNLYSHGEDAEHKSAISHFNTL